MPPIECGNPCQYDLRVMGRVNAENGLNPMETTYQCGETYLCKYNYSMKVCYIEYKCAYSSLYSLCSSISLFFSL